MSAPPLFRRSSPAVRRLRLLELPARSVLPPSRALAGASLTWVAVLCGVSSSASAPSPPGLPLCRSPSLLFRRASAGGRRPPPCHRVLSSGPRPVTCRGLGRCSPPGPVPRILAICCASGGRADSVPYAQGQALSLRSTCYGHSSRASHRPFDQARVVVTRSARSPRGGWGGASVPLALYVRASSVQAFEPCRPASPSTRAPGSLGRPQVRQSFWLPVTSSQAALPRATPLSLAADQHFPGADFTLAGLHSCG
ncbi:hypothetical protein NDU88_004692 [Pleurodeles waltl]|uniref:Uncharacterized protein n=1 Tax=Pleurodeles waltl TaxID=8319 RepID=A0AAV7PET3_PLEWA|nr:hypothetical protein NDU88_004692 [Pleurodeles waltl]